MGCLIYTLHFGGNHATWTESQNAKSARKLLPRED
jgi:hypothetical protein